jgi:hypothetical protein
MGEASHDKWSEGETDLSSLLASMAPKLHPETFVFCTLSQNEIEPPRSDILMRFREADETTLILAQTIAEARGFAYRGTWRMITLTVHSSLEAVGFLATVLPSLTNAGISTNVVSAFYHDHVFVPASRAQDALSILQSIASSQEITQRS